MKLFQLVAFILLGFVSSCSICDNINCENGGQCSLGVCDCPEGFGGEFCEKELICRTGALECQNGSACKGTWCDCQDFYIGDSCEMVFGQQYFGEYYGLATCFSPYSYVSCPDSLEANEARVSHCVNDYQEYFGFTLRFENDSTGVFEIPQQRYYQSYFSNRDSITITGSGYFSDSSMNYTLNLDYDNLNAYDNECQYDIQLKNRIDISKL